MAEPAASSGAPIHAISPDGKEVEIRPEMAAQAAEAGFQIQTADQYAAAKLEQQEGLGGAAKTALANVAKGATLGLSDVIGGELGGDEYRRSRALHDLAYQAAATGGELGGMVLPALLPGGVEVLGARGVAEGVEAASLLGRAGEAASGLARYSPAGLAMRGGEAVSGLVGRGLETAGLTGESLLGRAASSGLKMAAGGAVEGGAFGAGNALSEAALAPGGDYDNLAQKLWAGAIQGAEFGALGGGALGAGGELAAGVARKIGGTFSARKIVQDIADAKTLKSAGLRSDEISELAQTGRARELADVVRSEEGIGWSDSAAARAEKVGAAAKKSEETLATMRKGLDEVKAPGDGVDVRRVLDEWQTRAAELKDASTSLRGDRLAEKVDAEIARFRESFPGGERASFEAAHDLRQTIDDELRNYRGTSKEAKPFEQQMRRLRDDIEREFETSADRVMGNATPEFREQYNAAKGRHGALTELAGHLGNRASDLAEQNLGSMISGAAGLIGLGPKGVLLGAAHRAMRSAQADHIVGKLANELASLDSRVSSSMGKWGNAARKAAVEPTEARSLATLADRGRSVATSLAREGSLMGSHHEQARQYFAKLDAVEREARSEPGTLVSIPDSPKTEAAAENVRRRQAQWLLDQAPASAAQIKNPVMARLARQVPPNPAEIASWMRKVRAVEAPMSVLADFESGRLHPDQVKALEQTPAVLEKFRQAALEAVTDTTADISYEARNQLGVLLGVVTDPSLRPESIALSQQTYTDMRKERAQQEQQGGPPAPSAPGKAPTRGTSSRVDVLEEGVAI